MTYAVERADIVAHINDNWTDTPIDWENSPGGEPALPFIQPVVLNAAASNLSLQAQTVRYPGVISINVWEKQGAGTLAVNAHADALLTLLSNQDIGTNVETLAGYKTVLGESQGRYQINVTIPFERRE